MQQYCVYFEGIAFTLTIYAELLEKLEFITSVSDYCNKRSPIIEDGVEVAAEYVYSKPVCSKLLCKSNDTWYRYQINIYYREGAVQFTYSAVSRDGEIINDTSMSSKSDIIDQESSQKFAEAVGLGEADLYVALGPENIG